MLARDTPLVPYLDWQGMQGSKHPLPLVEIEDASTSTNPEGGTQTGIDARPRACNLPPLSDLKLPDSSPAQLASESQRVSQIRCIEDQLNQKAQPGKLVCRVGDPSNERQPHFRRLASLPHEDAAVKDCPIPAFGHAYICV